MLASTMFPAAWGGGPTPREAGVRAEGVVVPAEHVVVTGRASVLGSSGTFRLTLDRAGAFCFQADTPLPEAAGHTGSESWHMDPSSVPRRLHDHERDALLLWWRSWAGLDLDTMPAEPPDAPPGRRVHEVKLGGVTGRLTMGSQGRPTRIETGGVAGTGETTLYTGAIRVGGLVLPERSSTASAGVERRVLTVEEAYVSQGSVQCAAPVAPPAAFDPALPAELSARRAPTGHLLVRPVLNGVDVGWFIVDTGASTSVLSREAAGRVRAREVGRGVLISFTGAVEAPWYRLDRVTLGPMTVPGATFMEMDLAFLTEPLGTEVAGILGYGVLARAVVEAVPATGLLRLFAPDAHPFGSAPWQPLKLIDQVPVAEAAFSHGSGKFRLDLGAAGPAGGVVFHSPAVRALGLDSALASAAGAPTAPAVATILPWLELAGERFQDVPTLLWTADEGALADPHLTGNIGLTVLSGFSLVLDYRRERFALVPREEE